MACLEAFSEEACWPAQLPKRSALPPSEAEAGTLDECPVQDNELEAHRLQDHDAGRALAADPAQAAPPTQVVNNTVTFTDPDNRVKAHLHGNGPAAASRRASVSAAFLRKPTLSLQPARMGERLSAASRPMSSTRRGGASSLAPRAARWYRARALRIGDRRNTYNLMIFLDRLSCAAIVRTSLFIFDRFW